MTLAEFLLARISEDEAMVPEAFRSRPPVWRTGWDVDSDMVAVDHAHWLAECEAKRRIVAEHAAFDNPEDGKTYCRMCVTPDGFGTRTGGILGTEYPCRTLRLLALPFADHPDYDESWRPA